MKNLKSFRNKTIKTVAIAAAALLIVNSSQSKDMFAHEIVNHNQISQDDAQDFKLKLAFVDNENNPAQFDETFLQDNSYDTDGKSLVLNSNPYGFTYSDQVVRGRAIGAYSGLGVYLVGSVFVYNYIWYKDMDRAPFHFYDDNKDWLQMDKHGHMFSAYQQTRASYHLFRWIGYSKRTSLWVSSAISTFIQFQVEFWDGLHEGYGFSYGDIVANTLGTALFTTQQAIWDDQIFKLKFSYWPSKYREHSPEHLGDTHFKALFYDYNAHTQWISGSLRRITGIEAIPKWLNISVGFSGMGMLKEVDNSGIPGWEDYDRYRQTFLSLDIDLSHIKPRNAFLRGLVFVANMFKFPAPALEYNRVDGFKFRPLYF